MEKNMGKNRAAQSGDRKTDGDRERMARLADNLGGMFVNTAATYSKMVETRMPDELVVKMFAEVASSIAIALDEAETLVPGLDWKAWWKKHSKQGDNGHDKH